MQNPNWIRATLASIMLAILLRVGLGIPFFTTFIALGIIFVTHVVFTEMGTGVTNLWSGIKLTSNMVMGLVVFLALRFLAAKVLGLYPADTYETIDNSGGLRWILPGHDISSVILWEVCFAFVAGKLTVDWANNKSKTVGAIFVASLLVLTLQIALPKYTATWPNRDVVSATLVDNGVLGATAKGARVFLVGKPTPPPPAGSPATVYVPVVTGPPQIVYGTTPATIVADYGYNLESDAPIMVKYPGEKEFLFTPGGCQHLPQPRESGPKKFWDPKDPGNGKVAFRLYRIERPC